MSAKLRPADEQLIRDFNVWPHGPGTGGISRLIWHPDEIRKPLLPSAFDRDREWLCRVPPRRHE